MTILSSEHDQIGIGDAYTRLFLVGEQIAHLLGKMGHEHSKMPVGYNPLQDPDVLAFLEQAVTNEVQAESQQVRQLDALDREV